MKVKVGVLIFVLLLAGLGTWWLNSESSLHDKDAEPDLSSTPSPSPSPATASGVETATTAQVSTEIEAARQRVADAQLALETVAAKRADVEAQLEQAERDVTALERFIEDIEARGEDPADYADEGLEMFQPAFYAYQEAVAQLELVDSMHKAAEEEVAAAEKQLGETLAESDND